MNDFVNKGFFDLRVATVIYEHENFKCLKSLAGELKDVY